MATASVYSSQESWERARDRLLRKGIRLSQRFLNAEPDRQRRGAAPAVPAPPPAEPVERTYPSDDGTFPGPVELAKRAFPVLQKGLQQALFGDPRHTLADVVPPALEAVQKHITDPLGAGTLQAFTDPWNLPAIQALRAGEVPIPPLSPTQRKAAREQIESFKKQPLWIQMAADPFNITMAPAALKGTVLAAKLGTKLVPSATRAAVRETARGGVERARALPGQIPIGRPEVALAAADIPQPGAAAIRAAQSGKPFTARLFRGSGRATVEEAYDPEGLQQAIFGEGRYTTPNRQFAQEFGPQIEEVEVRLGNPLVISNDTEWSSLAQRAGLYSYKPITPEEVQKLRSAVTGQGYDGVVIHVPKSEATGKKLQRAIEQDTVVEFGEPGVASGQTVYSAMVTPPPTRAVVTPPIAAADVPLSGLSDMEARELYRLNTRQSLDEMKGIGEEILSTDPRWRPRPLRTAEERLEAIADAEGELKVAQTDLTEARASELYDAEELTEFTDAVRSARADLKEVSKEITDDVRKAYDDQIASANAFDKKIEAHYVQGTARIAELEAKQAAAAPIAPPVVVPEAAVPAARVITEGILPTYVRDSIIQIRKAVDEGVETYRIQGPQPSIIRGVPEREIPTGWRAGFEPDEVQLEVAMEARAEGFGQLRSEMQRRGVTLTPEIEGEINAARAVLERPRIRGVELGTSDRENVLLFDTIARRHGGKSIASLNNILGDVPSGHRLGTRLDVDWEAMGQPKMGTVADRDAKQAMDEVERLLYGPEPPIAAVPKAAVPAVAPVARAVEVPRGLAGSKPKYGDATPIFDSLLDKALYIVAHRGVLSRRDEVFLQYAMDATGLSKSQVIVAGERLRESMKALYVKGVDNFRVPSTTTTPTPTTSVVPEAARTIRGREFAEDRPTGLGTNAEDLAPFQVTGGPTPRQVTSWDIGGPPPSGPPVSTGFPPRDPPQGPLGPITPGEYDEVFNRITGQAARGESIPQTLLRRYEAAITTAETEARTIMDDSTNRLRALDIGAIRKGSLVPREQDIGKMDELFEALNNPSRVSSGEVRIPAGLEEEYSTLRGLTDWEQGMRLDFDPAMATVNDYFYRGWLIPKEARKVVEGQVVRIEGGIPRGRFAAQPSFKKPRVDATYREMRDLGFEPISWNPYEQWRISRLQGIRYRQQMQLLDDLKKLEMAKPSGSEIAIGTGKYSWRTPKIGPAFEGKPYAGVDEDGNLITGFTHRYAVEDRLAKSLETLFGPPVDLGKVGSRGTELIKAIDAVTFIPKRAKLFGSFFQQQDFLLRNYIGAWTGMVDALAAGQPIEAVRRLAVWPKSAALIIEANFNPGARARIRKELMSTTSFIPGRPDIHMRGIMEAGLSTIDTTILPANLDQTARVLATDMGKLGNKAVQRALGSLESSMRRGLYEGTYPAAQLTDIKNNIGPMIVRRYGKSRSDESLMGMIAKAANKKYSTIPRSQSVLQNRTLRETLTRVFFSIGESEGLLRQATGAIRGPEAGFWRTHWLGAYLGLIAMASTIHIASTGKPLPWGRWNPISRDGYGPLPVGYNPEFAAPDIPIKDPEGRNITLDIVGQLDTAFRILDPASFLTSRESVPIRAGVKQIETGRDYAGRPIDKVGPGGVVSRTANLINDMFTPIGPGQAAVQIGLQQEGVPKGLLPVSEQKLGTTGLAIQATGINLRARYGHRWDKELKAYLDIPRDPIERKSKGIVSPEQYRKTHPAHDAMLFITGRVNTIQTPYAANNVLRLVRNEGINPSNIPAIRSFFEDLKKRKKLGVDLGIRSETQRLNLELINHLLEMREK